MSDYFDYIHETSQEDIDDVDVIYNEYEMTINEFDTYVQEGVGLKILIGAGIIALLGGLIAVLVKMLSNSSSTSSSTAIKRAKQSVDLAKKYGVEKVKFGRSKQGWLSDEGMKHIKEVYEYTDLLCNSLDDIAKVIKSTDNPGSHNQDFKEKIENIYNRFFEQVESRGLLSTAATIGKKTPKAILDYLHEGTGMRLAYGEQDVEKDIKDIDHRLSTLKEYQKEAKRVLDRLVQLKKDFQNVLSEKQDLLKSDELNEYCQQFEPLIEIMEGVHKLITDSSNSITSAINIEKIINRLAGM